MAKIILLLLSGFFAIDAYCQPLSSSSIFSHNDYASPKPLFAAYLQRAGFIEVDVFLHHDELRVAHLPTQVKRAKDIEELYLKPLQNLIDQNEGNVYPDHSLTLTLMVDIKTGSVATMKAFIQKLNTFPSLIHCKNLFITITGNTPTSNLKE